MKMSDDMDALTKEVVKMTILTGNMSA